MIFEKDIEEAFHEKRGDVKEQAEALQIVHFKTSGSKSRPPFRGQPFLTLIVYAGVGRSKYGESKSADRKSTTTSSSYQRRQSAIGTAGGTNPPPPYTPGSTTNGASDRKAGGPPPPKPKPAGFAGKARVEQVTALYDYAAQADGELSFKAGDVIEVVSKTDDANEWWTGNLNGVQGVFPGNYVQL